MPTLLGPDGRPLTVTKTDLTRELAAPRLDYWRQAFRPTVARGMTPEQLAALLDAAAAGQPRDFMAFAEDLEERDPHYAGVLGIRKRAVLGLERHVVAASDAPRDIELRDAVETALVAAPAFGGLLAALLDGLAKGYSVVEIVWNTRQSPWTPDRYLWRDPRWFILDPVDGETLTLADSFGATGQPLPDGKFIVHRPRLKMGVVVRGGLARLAAAVCLCRHLVLESWLAYCESYGAPARIAKADDRFFASDAAPDQQAFLTDLQTKLETMLGADAHAVFPKSVDVVLQEATPGRAEVFERLMERLEKLISKAVLGRSDASDATAGRLGGETQAGEVRQDILEGDAEELANTINTQLVRPFIDLNFGPQAAYPRVVLRTPDAEDLAGLTDMLAKLVPLGLQVEQSIIRDKWGLPDPAPDGERLGTPAPAAPPALNRALNQIPPNPPFTKGGGEAGGISDPTAPLVDRIGTEAEPLLDALLEPVRQLLARADSLEEFRDSLLALYPDLDPSAFATLMGQALAVADAAGRFEAGRTPVGSARNRAESALETTLKALASQTESAMTAITTMATRPIVIEQKLDPIQVTIESAPTPVAQLEVISSKPVIRTIERDPVTGLIARIIDTSED